MYASFSRWFQSFIPGAHNESAELFSGKDREKEIIILRFGLNGDKPKTQNEIAKLMGISRSYVSRIETKAIHKLSKEFEE